MKRLILSLICAVALILSVGCTGNDQTQYVDPEVIRAESEAKQAERLLEVKLKENEITATMDASNVGLSAAKNLNNIQIQLAESEAEVARLKANVAQERERANEAEATINTRVREGSEAAVASANNRAAAAEAREETAKDDLARERATIESQIKEATKPLKSRIADLRVKFEAKDTKTEKRVDAAVKKRDAYHAARYDELHAKHEALSSKHEAVRARELAVSDREKAIPNDIEEGIQKRVDAALEEAFEDERAALAEKEVDLKVLEDSFKARDEVIRAGQAALNRRGRDIDDKMKRHEQDVTAFKAEQAAWPSCKKALQRAYEDAQNPHWQQELESRISKKTPMSWVIGQTALDLLRHCKSITS